MNYRTIIAMRVIALVIPNNAVMAESPGDLPPPPVRGFVAIPGGSFEMGDHHDLGDREQRNDEVPVHTVQVDSFCMATTEVTNRQYCGYLNAASAAGLVEVQGGLVHGAGGDGEISAEELQRASAALKGVDIDGDGKLAGDELRPPRR